MLYKSCQIQISLNGQLIRETLEEKPSVSCGTLSSTYLIQITAGSTPDDVKTLAYPLHLHQKTEQPDLLFLHVDFYSI